MLFNKQNPIQGIALGLMIALVFEPGAAIAESSPSFLKLAQAHTNAKQDGQAWIKKGHDLRAAKKYEEALQAYRKAESLGAGSDALTFDIADTYDEMGRYREAYWEYSKANNSKNHESRMIACEKTQELSWARNRYLNDPYFADLYTAVGWQSVGDTAYIDMKARAGRYVGDDAEIYAYAALARDNRSGIVGGFPEDFYENAGRVGVGASKGLTDHLSVYAEAGLYRDLLEHETLDEFNAGIEYYRDWNMEYDCRSTNTRPNRFIMSVYSSLTYSALEDDDESIDFEITARPGIRMVETRKTDVDAFLHLSYGTNFKEHRDGYSELAVGVRWVPNRDYGFAVEARTGRNFYEEGGSESSSVIELQHYISW